MTNTLHAQAQAREVEKKTEAAAIARAAAVESLSAMVDEPRRVWQAAVDLVKKYIPAANAYVANIVEDEEPDRATGDAEAGDGAVEEGGKGAASEDEEGEEGDVGMGSAILALLVGSRSAAGTEGEEAEEGEEAAGRGAEEEGMEGGATSERSAFRQADYSTKLLSYVAASSGQEFMTKVELRRRPVAAAGSEGQSPRDMTGEGGAAADAVVPATFRILDEHLPLLEVGRGWVLHFTRAVDDTVQSGVEQMGAAAPLVCQQAVADACPSPLSHATAALTMQPRHSRIFPNQCTHARADTHTQHSSTPTTHILDILGILFHRSPP